MKEKENLLLCCQLIAVAAAADDVDLQREGNSIHLFHHS